MRDFGDAARDAIAAGEALSVGAVRIDISPDPICFWGGYGELVIEGQTFLGIGDKGLISATSAAMGGAEENLTLELSGVDPDVLAQWNLSALRRAPVICYRLVFDAHGTTLLAAPVFRRGRIEEAPKSETSGGTATIKALVESAARGLGATGARVRSQADQTLIDPEDDGLKGVSYAGETLVYFGGKIPSTAKAAFSAQDAVTTALDEILR